jgi:NAD(P)H-quinone oxidoreductase subunit 5
MELLYQYAWIIPVLPLFGATLLGLGLISFGRTTNSLRLPASILSIGLMAGAMVYSIALLVSQLKGHANFTSMFEWAKAGDFHLEMGYTIDHLTALMLVIVTTVAVAVMIYTDGYMSHDPGYVRFYAYLSLFGSSMLGLVLSPNLVQVYIFWELVGMCSYLLIGFWYDRPAAAEACQKAFVTNRVGDFGLLLGMLGLYWATGSFDFAIMGDRLANLLDTGAITMGLATLFGILVFLGPVAKSAQFPLHVWLPDAMEGPTPISALIHAATMVAAGVFLIARMYPVLVNLPTVMTIIACTGAFTALLGATIALTQNDIKKGLAYSTISQLGYMVLAMGVGGYSAGLFHLMTHAYFKAMLFLGSGSVIHGMEAAVGHNPILAQDMRMMGNLRKYMPITAGTFFIGTLAISGIPPFAGFWSKDEILDLAFQANPLFWIVGWLTAGLTAFYMFRMYFMTFEGKFRGDDQSIRKSLLAFAKAKDDPEHSEQEHHHKPHESPWTMTLPLLILAFPSVLIGLVGKPWDNSFEEFIKSPVTTHLAEEGPFNWQQFYLMAGSSIGIALIGISIAIVFYLLKKYDPSSLSEKFPTLYQLSLNKWYIDDIYNTLFVKGLRRLARGVMEVDYKVIDGAVNLTGLATLLSGEGLKYLENGRAQFYALIVFAAVLGFVIVFSVT